MRQPQTSLAAAAPGPSLNVADTEITDMGTILHTLYTAHYLMNKVTLHCTTYTVLCALYADCMQTTDYRLQTNDNCSKATDYRLQTPDYSLTTNYRL